MQFLYKALFVVLLPLYVLSVNAEKLSLPTTFVQRTFNEVQDAAEFLSALESEAPTSVRLHPVKKRSIALVEEVVPWCPMGRYLAKRPSFTLDPSFHAGVYYPQEAASMFIDFALRSIKLPENPICLDMCAAPGGKSGLLLDFLKGKGMLVANEVVRNRALILRENIIRWGYPNVLVSNNNPEDFSSLSAQFDCILIDAPCSGEGMFRKDRNARNEWSEEHATACTLRQRSIVKSAVSSLSEGGFLLYSTCTFNAEENEKNVAWMCEAFDLEHVALPIEEKWNITIPSNGMGYAFLPHKIKSEGFYAAVLQKGKTGGKRKQNCQKIYKKEQKVALPSTVQKIIDDAELRAVEHKGSCYAFPITNFELAYDFLHQLRVVKWGIRIGELLRSELHPDHELAMSLLHLENSFPKVEVNKEKALQFLKGHPIAVDTALGWCLVAYEENVLGWLKNIGKRTNNYFPKEYRIRMDIS